MALTELDPYLLLAGWVATASADFYWLPLDIILLAAAQITCRLSCFSLLICLRTAMWLLLLI